MNASHYIYNFPEIEIWQPVPNYEEYYSISNYGRLRRDKAIGRHKAPRIQKPEIDQDGYFRVTLSKLGIGRRVFVHYLVSLVFLGQREPGLVVNHKDGRKQNNHPSNLEYVTGKENSQHAKRLGLYRAPNLSYEKRARGERIGCAKLTSRKVKTILQRLKKGETHKSIAHDFNVSRPAISLIARGEKWKHIPRP